MARNAFHSERLSEKPKGRKGEMNVRKIPVLRKCCYCRLSVMINGPALLNYNHEIRFERFPITSEERSYFR